MSIPSDIMSQLGGEGGGMPSAAEMQQQQAQQQQQEEMRTSILDQILEPASKERLTRLNLVRKDKARAVEDALIKAATSGQLRGKVTEEQLIGMLEGTSDANGEAKGKAVSVQRRNYGMDSDDDDNDDDLM